MSRSCDTIPMRFAGVVSSHGKRVAISTPDGEWTYEELNQRSTAIAAAILSHTQGADEPVASLMEHGALLIATILGALKAGRMYLALDPGDPPARLTALLNDSQARALFADAANLSLARSLASNKVQIVEARDDLDFGSVATSFPEVHAGAGAWLMYTSGSTGTPKGVWQNHRGVVHNSDVYSELIQLTPGDRLTLLTSCSLAASATHLFAALLNGAALCPFPVRTQGVGRLPDWLRVQRVSVYHSVPTVFRHLMRAVDDDGCLESLRLVRLGGEPMLRRDVELFRRHCPSNCVLMHTLSSTEAGLTCALTINRQMQLPGRRIPVGQPVRDVEVTLVDERGQPVADGGEGRIAIRSAFLSQGYWQQPDAAEAAFRSGASDSAQRLFISADLGRFHPNGDLEHLGRVDQQVKIRGRRVDLAEVESALCATEFVREAAVAAHEELSGDQRLVAYIVPHDANRDVSRACRRALARVLPDYMVPSAFVSLAKLPQTAGGKINRRDLPPWQPHFRELAARGLGPRKGIESRLAVIWKGILGVSNIGRRDDFFDLGGDSLRSVQMLIRIEEKFGVVLPPSVLVEFSTIEQLAERLAKHTVFESAGPLILMRDSTAARPPLFLMHSGEGNVAVYGQLARRLPDRPVYGLQSVGLDGNRSPLNSIPDMARCYLRAIFARVPTGPYLLGGARMGALVAFEMAQQLARQGKPAGLVAMLDFLPPRPRTFCARPLAAARRARDRLRILRWSLIRELGRNRKARWLTDYREFIAKMNCHSRHDYAPAYYPGTITVFVTADRQAAAKERRLDMSHYAREVRVITIPGNRSQLFVRPAVDELAARLHACMETVPG